MGGEKAAGRREGKGGEQDAAGAGGRRTMESHALFSCFLSSPLSLCFPVLFDAEVETVPLHIPVKGEKPQRPAGSLPFPYRSLAATISVSSMPRALLLLAFFSHCCAVFFSALSQTIRNGRRASRRHSREREPSEHSTNQRFFLFVCGSFSKKKSRKKPKNEKKITSISRTEENERGGAAASSSLSFFLSLQPQR